MAKSLCLLALVLVFSLVQAGEEEAGGIRWMPQSNKQCGKDFTTFADKTVAECQSICSQIDGCDEFSSPIENHMNGCRVAKGKTGCKPEGGDAKFYKATMVVENEKAPDVEGPGARRRRRSDSRRRTHMPIKTRASMQLAAIQQKEDKKKEEAAARMAPMMDPAVRREQLLISKETITKVKYNGMVSDAKIRAEIERLAADKKGIAAADGLGLEKGMTTHDVAKVQIRVLQKQVTKNKVEIPLLKRQVMKEEGGFDMAVLDGHKVAAKVKAAEKAIEVLMMDPGAMADQDRSVAVAILGKLRVAGALVNGDLPSLSADQHSHEYLVHMRKAMIKAVRNPSVKNVMAAKVAYKTATNIMTQNSKAAVKETVKEAKDLATKTKALEQEQQLSTNAGAAKDADNKEQAAIAADATKAAIGKAAVDASGDPSAIPPEVTLPKPPLPPRLKPGQVYMPRGYYDAPAAGETFATQATNELGATQSDIPDYQPSTDLPGDF